MTAWNAREMAQHYLNSTSTCDNPDCGHDGYSLAMALLKLADEWQAWRDLDVAALREAERRTAETIAEWLEHRCDHTELAPLHRLRADEIRAGVWREQATPPVRSD